MATFRNAAVRYIEGFHGPASTNLPNLPIASGGLALGLLSVFVGISKTIGNMKKNQTALAARMHPHIFLAIAIILTQAGTLFAEIIPANRRVTWQPGVPG